MSGHIPTARRGMIIEAPGTCVPGAMPMERYIINILDETSRRVIAQLRRGKSKNRITTSRDALRVLCNILSVDSVEGAEVNSEQLRLWRAARVVKRMRLRADRNIYELAASCGVAAATLSAFENGTNVSARTAFLASIELDCRVYLDVDDTCSTSAELEDLFY